MKEYEEEERQKRLGPGGLDPVEVYESLPPVSSQEDSAWLRLFICLPLNISYRVGFELQEMQKCFDDKDIQMLQDVITKMDPTVSYFLKLHKLLLWCKNQCKNVCVFIKILCFMFLLNLSLTG